MALPAERHLGAAGAAVLGVLAASCGLQHLRPVEKLMSKASGESKWYRIAPGPVVTTVNEDVRKEQDERRERYERQFSLQWLDRDTSCAALVGPDQGEPAPVYILVHGVGGDGPEWWPVIPELASTHPAAIFMFKWSPIGQHHELVDTLAAGVVRISECFPNAAPLVVLGHSAGGVIASFAAHNFTVAPAASGPRLWLLTVASPLAGTGYRSGQEEDHDDESRSRLVYEMGGAQLSYEAAAPGVSVINFRTRFPADRVMRPSPFGHAPNEPGAGVPGAREVELPPETSHEESVLIVAKELAAGRAP